MSIIDIISLAVIGLNVFLTLRKGVIRTVFETAGIFIGALVSYIRCDEYALLLEIKTGISGFPAVLISYIGIYAVTFFAFIVLGFLVQKIIHKTMFAPVSHALAIVLGTVKGVFFSTIIVLLFILASRFAEPLKAELASSYMAGFVNKVVVSPIKGLIPDDMGEKIAGRFNIKKIIQEEIANTMGSATDAFDKKSMSIRQGMREQAKDMITGGLSKDSQENSVPEVSEADKEEILKNLQNNEALKGMDIDMDSLRKLLDEQLRKR